MSDPKQLAQDFLDAIAANTAERYAAIFTEDVGLLIGRWDGREIHRPRPRVVKRLMEEWSSWPDPSIGLLSVLVDND